MPAAAGLATVWAEVTRNINKAERFCVHFKTFYFDQGNLIKVEEYIIEKGKEQHADWYYADDKPLYFTIRSERSEERAALLLNMARTMLKQFQK